MSYPEFTQKEEWSVKIVTEDLRGRPLRSPEVVVEHKGERIEFEKLQTMHYQLMKRWMGAARETIFRLIRSGGEV